ncbi:hypothetical protein HanRHA438_Chr09g0383341 [Helianthus annuus]|nr:hypothetical protein HanRHA438_Chr09g0383341 [Helianthus annuus]
MSALQLSLSTQSLSLSDFSYSSRTPLSSSPPQCTVAPFLPPVSLWFCQWSLSAKNRVGGCVSEL